MKTENIIDNELFCNMFPLNIKPGRLHFLPKIHKTSNPDKLIVLGNDTATEKLSAFVDFHLTKYMDNYYIPSFIKDTTKFLNHLLDLPTLPDNSLLVTMDIKSLYTNIPSKDGVEAIKQIMNKYNTDPK